MRRYLRVASIDAPREIVWRILSDVSAWAQWLPTVMRVEMLDGSALRPGARFIVHQPALRPAKWKVVEVDEPRSFKWEARFPGLRMVADHRVERVSATQSVVELEFTFDGYFAGVAAWAYADITQRYLGQEAAALKLASEEVAAAAA